MQFSFFWNATILETKFEIGSTSAKAQYSNIRGCTLSHPKPLVGSKVERAI